MSSDYDLTIQDIKDGIRLCYQKVNSLLDGAESILNRGDRHISSGLYTYAVEELGKLLLLQKESRKTPSSNIISVDPAIFGRGRGKHPTIKFDEFKNEPTIPVACKELRYVAGGVPITQHIQAGEVQIPVNVGIIPIFGKVSTDFLLRQNIFYIDRNNGQWFKHLDIEIGDLQRAIIELRQWMTTLTIP